MTGKLTSNSHQTEICTVNSAVEQINPVQYRVRVEVPVTNVNAAFDAAYRKLQKKAKIQGFRPGKAPLGMIKKLYGASVNAEVHESLINTHLFPALNEQALRPIASPVIESGETPRHDQVFKFSAVIDTLPKLDFSDYKAVPVTAEAYSVKDATVAREIAMLTRRAAKTRAVDDGTVAASGLLAGVTHRASLDGIDVPAMHVQAMTIALGNNELFDGLEKEIIGMKIGETKQAQVTLPDDYGDAEIAGKTLDFSITLDDLKHLDIPVLDDEFAKDIDFESADDLKAKIREHLEARAKDMGRQKLEGAILDKILAKHDFDVPPAMVDQVIDSLIQDLQHPNEESRKQALADEGMREHFRQTARRRTQNTLVLWHVTQKEQLQVTEEELATRLDQTLGGMGIRDPKQIAAARRNLEARLRESMIFEKAMDFLIDNAEITELPADL